MEKPVPHLRLKAFILKSPRPNPEPYERLEPETQQLKHLQPLQQRLSSLMTDLDPHVYLRRARVCFCVCVGVHLFSEASVLSG